MSDQTSHDSDLKMSFVEHLEELRKRIIRSLVAIFVGMIGCWFFREEILDFMFAPLYSAWSQVDGLPAIENLLNFSSLIEPFVAQLKLSALGGVFVAAPVVLYQLWKFIAPGLYPKEKKLAGPFVLVSSLLFVGGSIMAYAIVFPIGFRFFLDFAAGRDMDAVEARITVGSPHEPLQPEQIPKPVASPPATAAPKKALESTSAPTPPPPDTGFDTDGGAGTDTEKAVEQNESSTDTGTLSDTDAKKEPGADTLALKDPETTPTGEATSSTSLPDSDPGDARAEGNAAAHSPKTPAPSKSASPQAATSNKDERSWYDFLFAGIFKKHCARVAATNGAEGKTIVLTFTWRRNSCGKAPPIEKVLIDGDRVETSFSPVRAPVGRVAFEGIVPAPSTSGEHHVEIFYPSNPHTKKLSPVLMISDYLSFAIRILLAFGLIFELPILISFLALAGIVNYKQLIRFSRWFIVIAVIVGAMLTPPDVVTQLMLAAPLVVLYFLSIVVAFFFGPKVE